MKRLVWVALAASLVAVVLLNVACPDGGGMDPGGGAHAGRAAADNSFCYVCHINYKEEKLARRHARAGVGCEKCHGRSDKHSSDEDGVTAPDVMFPREKINPFCMTCHPAGKLKRKIAHWSVLDGKAKEGKNVCTDCHGKHRLKVRTRRWDKTTGKLIADDGVRMTGGKRPATAPAR